MFFASKSLKRCQVKCPPSPSPLSTAPFRSLFCLGKAHTKLPILAPYPYLTVIPISVARCIDPEIDRVELHDRSRTIADRLDFWPLSRLDSTLINGDRLDRLFSWQFSLFPVAWIGCVVCELVKPFRSCVLMYRRSGLTLAVSLTIS